MIEREPGKVSIVITNYNREAYLKECLDSLLRQTYANREIILIDDASADQSLEVAEAWVKENGLYGTGLVTILPLPRNIGFSGAMTAGFFLARGEFIAVQDSDDYSHPTRIEKQVSFLRSRTDVDLVGCNYAYFEDGAEHRRYIKANWLRYGDDIRKVYANGGHCICHGTIMFRGAVFDRVGGLTRGVVGAEDYEFIVKFLNIGSRIDNIPEVLYYYRTHAEQRSLNYFSKKEG